jgi:hypothetical protein
LCGAVTLLCGWDGTVVVVVVVVGEEVVGVEVKGL